MSETMTAPAAAPATTAATTEPAQPIGSGLGGASATPPATAPATTQPAPSGPWNWTKEDGGFNDGWRDRLPDDLKGVKDLEKYKDLPSVLRTVVHQQKMIGADKLPLPSKNATPEELAKWDGWNRLGRPDTPEGYDLKKLKALPEGVPYDYDGEKAFLKEMHGLGMTQHQVNGVFAKYRETVGGQFGQLTEKQKIEAAASSDAIRKEYGQAFEKKMFQAEDYARRELGEGADKFLQKHKLDADVIRLLVRASENNQEDRSVHGRSPNLSGNLTPAEAKRELDEMLAAAQTDAKHPLRDKMNPMYKTMNDRRLKLFEFMTPAG